MLSSQSANTSPEKKSFATKKHKCRRIKRFSHPTQPCFDRAFAVASPPPTTHPHPLGKLSHRHHTELNRSSHSLGIRLRLGTHREPPIASCRSMLQYFRLHSCLQWEALSVPSLARRDVGNPNSAADSRVSSIRCFGYCRHAGGFVQHTFLKRTYRATSISRRVFPSSSSSPSSVSRMCVIDPAQQQLQRQGPKKWIYL